MTHKPLATETALLTAYNDRYAETHVLPLARIDIVQVSNHPEFFFMYGHEIRFRNDSYNRVILDLTDDPTSSRAGDWTSLGYFRLRLIFKEVSVVSRNPAKFVFKEYEQQLLLPER